MNKFFWESEEYKYVRKIEEIPASQQEQIEKEDKYLYHVKNFKQRHKKLLNKLARKLDVSNWHSCLKVGRLDILGRCINPIIATPEQNKEKIIRRNVFKALYKYSSLAINRNLLVKDISTEEESKLIFTSPIWMTPNFCIVFIGLYNVEGFERQVYVKEINNLFT